MMDKKDTTLLEELFSTDDPARSNYKTFTEVENRLLQSKYDFDKNISAERQKINFKEDYESIPQLKVLNKEYAEKLIQDINFLGVVLPTDLDDILSIGIYNAHKTGQMQLLKDALHTKNRLRYGTMLQLTSGYNHSGSFLEVIQAFADCDKELVKKYFPIELGLADQNSHNFLRCGSNLIISMFYHNELWIQESSELAHKFLNQKSSNTYDKQVIEYLLALSKSDMLTASDTLQEIANNYKKTTWLFNFKNPFLKFFGVYVHGLYNLAYFVLSESKFQELKIPEHTVFWNEFDTYTKKNKFTSGSYILKTNDKLSGLGRLFEF